ncbi:glycosyltransferase [Kalaharituber pfeilii]|nr:glycosyltransferase [Kalaharituber pfeilii]
MEPMAILRSAIGAASNPKYSKYLAPLIFVADVVFSIIILHKVPYTEIDWTAYMEQVSQYLSGERDYVKIRGGTGPLVYPAGHVYIYSFLYKITDEGRDIFRAQVVFTGVYLATLAVVLAVYVKAKAPPYLLPLLILSKRLHSIYILRLFNDTFSVFFLFLSILLYQHRMYTAGSLAYSLSVSVKMHTLLALPGIGAILLMCLGRDRALNQASLMAQIQVVLAWPFARHNFRSYVSRAFDFSREFLWTWTVNWRWLGEPAFRSRGLKYSLLAAHAGILAVFILTRWLKPARAPPLAYLRTHLLSPPQQSSLQAFQLAQRVTPRFMLTTILGANLIGALCARSLHYQFYSWIAWGAPWAMYAMGAGPVPVYVLWAAQEWAWNVYPSTVASSATVVGSMGVVVAGVWWATRVDGGAGLAEGEEERKENKKRV